MRLRLRAGLTHFPSLWTCAGGSRASRWEPPAGWMSSGPPGRRTISGRGQRPRLRPFCARQVRLSLSADGIRAIGSPGQTRGTPRRDNPHPLHQPATPLENKASGGLKERARARTRTHTRAAGLHRHGLGAPGVALETFNRLQVQIWPRREFEDQPLDSWTQRFSSDRRTISV